MTEARAVEIPSAAIPVGPVKFGPRNSRLAPSSAARNVASIPTRAGGLRQPHEYFSTSVMLFRVAILCNGVATEVLFC